MKKCLDQARERMKGFCRVCPRCDGRPCSGETPGMGGIGSGAAFRNNITALDAVRLNMELIHDVKFPDAACRILGLDLAMPIIAAPVGGVSFNMSREVAEKDYVKAVLEGCLECGTVGSCGDGPLDTIYEDGLAALTATKGRGIPFIKPWESSVRNRKIEAALELGCKVIGMDIDAAGLIGLRKMGKPVSPLPVEDLRALASKVQEAGAAFVVKGIMTSKDAQRAVDAGIDGIVVSNHGGRVLDHTPGTAEVLPRIVDAVKGKIAILVDGGVRSGQDVFKMLALGAEAVMVGRPIAIAAIGDFNAGVRGRVEQFSGELQQAMILTGCASLKDIDKSKIA